MSGSSNNHGNTPAAWTLSIMVMLAFVIGLIAILMGNWVLFWIGGVGLAVAAAIVGRVMSSMGYGKQTKSA
jgi:1,4-dihydroxy-2-naphthoate octaprenyltransferase